MATSSRRSLRRGSTPASSGVGDAPPTLTDPRPRLLDDAARKRIAGAAVRFLFDAVERIETARSLPLPGRESPWIDDNRIWNILGRDVGPELTKAIEAEMPDRGQLGSRYPWPDRYPIALLRAVIASATVKQERPSGNSQTAWECIGEMLDQLTSRDQLARVIHLLTHVDVSAVAGATLHHVRLEPVRELDRTIAREMTEAAAEVLRLPSVMLGSREPRALAIADCAGEKENFELTRQARAHLWHTVTALRLMTAATITQVVEIEGHPSMVHAYPPSVVALDPEPASWWHRLGALRPDEMTGLDAMARIICELDERSSKETPSVVLAIGRFNRSFRPAIWQDHIVDLSIGLEAALSSGEREGLTLALKSRAAHLLATSGDPATEIFADVGDLTALRGKVVHGAVVPQKDWDRIFKRRALGQVLLTDRLAIAIDRWRDLLRRAILARLMLSEMGASDSTLWSLVGGPVASIDGLLVGPVERRRWRQSVRTRARRLGIEPALNEPSPLRDTLHEPHGSTLDN